MAASREYICVRLATYESQEEADVLTSFFEGRGGLENTTTVLVAPDGKTPLSRAGRGPAWMIDGVDRGPEAEVRPEYALELASFLAEKSYPYRHKRKPESLPLSLDFRRALNVAACDNQPLAVIVASSERLAGVLTSRVAKLAWSDDYIGRLGYAIVSDRSELALITNLPDEDGIYIIQPDTFGQAGAVVAGCKGNARANAIAAAFDSALAGHTIHEKDFHRHVMDGNRKGIKWNSQIPITDPGPRGRRSSDNDPPRRRNGGGSRGGGDADSRES